jgi:hypothetical protein
MAPYITYPDRKKRITVEIDGGNNLDAYLPGQEVNLRSIREHPGHRDPKTKEIYTRTTRISLNNIQSPLDKLEI